MKRSLLAMVLWAVLAPMLPGDVQPGAPTHQVKLNGHTFTLPAAFEIELAAGPPLVERPITADFDEQGRLYVSDSSGSNENVKVQLQKKPHRILRLADTKGAGTFDQRTVFADKMMFPEGTMWYKGALYVSAVPAIWKLTDSKGIGSADRRDEWFNGKTLTGCANDLHGPYLGPDGWIYWAKGAFAEQRYERAGKKPLVTRAAHLFRARPDGSGIEPIMTGGMDNPVDVVFTPGGERVFTCTFLQFPGGGRRDGLIHAVYGGVYGKDWDVLREHPWTSTAVMPVLAHLGAAAPCGLTRYESAVFGREYQHNLFACLFNMQKVTRHVLQPQGATFACHTEDFLVSDNKDFHPTDVLEDADGSLLVVDTGGWYKICCPTSQLVKPDVLGAIYRVRRRGSPQIDDPRGLKRAWATMSADELAGLLGDGRPAVRRRAIQALADQGKQAVPALVEVLRSSPLVEARRNAVWSATRIKHPSARSAVRRALADRDETVRQAAIHSISVWRDHDALPRLIALLKKPSMQNRRAAAEALGRLGAKAAVPILLAALAEPGDRTLEHSLTYALIEIGDREETVAGLTSPSANARRAALMALDQMETGKLPPQVVTRELSSDNPRLKETAWWIVTRHPEWGAELAAVVRTRLAARDTTPAERDELAGQLGKLARNKAIQDLLAEQLGRAKAPVQARLIVLKAMAQAGLKEIPPGWLDPLTRVLAGAPREVQVEAIATARALRLPPKGTEKLAAQLRRIGHNAKAPADVRLAALAAAPGVLPKVEPDLFAFVRGQLNRDVPVARRLLAADVLARAKLAPSQLSALADLLKCAGPMELDRLLDVFGQSSEAALGKRVVAALAASPARSALRPDALRKRLAKFGTAVQKQAEKLLAELDVTTAEQRVKLDNLLVKIKNGDVRRGQAVFNSAKAACSSCHAIGYLGGTIGPDLTRIGQIRTERDLLESIVFPSASFVRSYEPVLVTTHDGKVINGLIRQESRDELVLATGPNQEVRVAREDVEDIQPSRVSIMPAGLDQQLTPQELADLVTFLKACR